MTNIDWYIGPIEPYLDDIKQLFLKNSDHRHSDNYLKYPLFNETKFARLGWHDNKVVYYSAGIERPEYNGSIRVMSRHTRDRDFDFGGRAADLVRGIETLDSSTKHALSLGYKEIWVSREENPNLLNFFKRKSAFTWDVLHKNIPRGGNQYVLEIVNFF